MSKERIPTLQASEMACQRFEIRCIAGYHIECYIYCAVSWKNTRARTSLSRMLNVLCQTCRMKIHLVLAMTLKGKTLALMDMYCRTNVAEGGMARLMAEIVDMHVVSCRALG